MSPNLFRQLCPKWGSIGELPRRRTAFGDQNPQPDPGSLSPLHSETTLGETTSEKPQPQPDHKSGPIDKTQSQETVPRGPNPKSNPGYISPLFGDAPLRAATMRGLNPQPNTTSPSPLDGEAPLRGITIGERNAQPDLNLPRLIDETRQQGTTPGGPNPRPSPNAQEDNPPPPYVTGALSRETTPGGPNPRPDPNTHEDTPPTPNAGSGLRGALSPQERTPGGPNPPTPNATSGVHVTHSHSFTEHGRIYIRESVTLETLRGHNPAARTPRASTYVQTPPLHRSSRHGDAGAAACSTVAGITRAFDERDPRMVAARTAQAIAVAVSTTCSHTALVAAVTAAETFALLAMEDPHYQFPLPSDQYRDRSRRAVDIATNTAVAGKLGFPSTSRAYLNAVAFIMVSWALVTVLWWAIKVVAALILYYSQQY